MKRTFLFAVTALAALMATSCQKDDLGRILTATIEQYEQNGDSKAYINDDHYACWSNNDKVKINGTQYTVSVSDGNEHNYTATIQGQVPTGQDLLAYYPASQVTNLSSTGGTVTLPSVQTYRENNGHQIIDNPMSAYCPADGTELKFRNMCALLKVTINATTSVKAIQVKGVDNQMLWGTAQLKLNGQSLPVLGEFSKGSNSVTLNFNDPTEVLGSKSFYIVVPGGTNFANLTIAVLTKNGDIYTHNCKTSPMGQSLARNQIGAIGYTLRGNEDDDFTPDWMIRYTASAQVTPYGPNHFGSSTFLVSVYSPTNHTGYILFDRPITQIGYAGFSECTNLISITLPASVTEIGDYAFNKCSNLFSIAIPERVTTIRRSAFSECTDLSSITLPAAVTEIGSSAFAGCTSITSIIFPAGVTTIKASMFEGCTSLIGVTLPTGVTEIEDHVFKNCSSLVSVFLPDNLTTIGEAVFYECTGLSGITFPKRVTEIKPYMFQGCSKLSSVILPDNLTTIGASAFDECTSLRNITLPAGVTSIGDYAFYKCTSLSSINLPSTLTMIGYFAFVGCSSLTSISLPASLTLIGDQAFYECSSLAQVDSYRNTSPTLGSAVFYGISSIAKLHVPREYSSNYSSWSSYFGGGIEDNLPSNP